MMPDHFGPRFAIGPALVLAAEATTRLRVGSFVYDNDFRHPALLAQEAATIDTLTDGRFDFGIGAGWLKREYDAAGITFDRGQARVERLAEALSIIKQLLTGEPVTFRGRFYQLEDLSAGFKPVQRPYPRLVIGGGGRRLLGLASEHADIISVMPRARADGSGLKDSDATEGAFAEKIAWIEEAAGGRFTAIELNTLVQAVIVTNDVQGEAERLSGEWQLPVNDVLGSPLLLIGSVEQIAATLEQRRERLGISSITVFEKDLDNFSGVISRLRH
jgi:probable F420-dependent oxidoreductase